jgi:beta-glucosidase
MNKIPNRFPQKRYRQVELSDLNDEEEPRVFGGIPEHLEVAKRLVLSCDERQKVRMLSGLDMWRLKPVPALRIPALWLCEGSHGLSKQVGRAWDLVRGRVPATCFPTASALACSWDRELLHDIGVAMGRECVSENVAVLLGPSVNVIRTPLGGRNFDNFSEDPLLVGHLAAAMISGIQSQGVSACAKRLCVYNQDSVPWILDTIVDERTLREIYWKSWELVVKLAQPWAIMCANNKVNGLYCSENRILIKRILRGEWGFQGLVMTDWAATNERWKGIVAGIDLEMPGSRGAHDFSILEAYYDGRVTDEHLNELCSRVLSLMIMGATVASESVRATVDAQAHHQLAYRAAVNSCVLLKNENKLLPLKPGTSVAVIGNFAAFPRIQPVGTSHVIPTQVDCAFDRFQDHTLNIQGVQGYSNSENEALERALIGEAIDVARSSEVAIVFLGLTDWDETEGVDRKHMDLPECQETLLEKVFEANPKTIVVLTNGSPVTMPWASDIPCILEGWLSGQGGGSAIADIIFGEAEPSGKLAQTFPVDIEDVPSCKWVPGSNHQVEYRENINVGYRYYNSADTEVLFPFGHGLTYTTFEYSSLKVTVVKDSNEEIAVEVSVSIRNSGNRPGSEIVQCYVYDCERSLYRPYHELQGFEKVNLLPNESKVVAMSLDQTAFRVFDVGTRTWILEPGNFEIQIGASSRDIRLKQAIRLVSGTFASGPAKLAHPNKAFPIDKVQDSDPAFVAMLGYEIPIPPASTGLFHYNTPLQEIKTSSLGSTLFNFVERRMIREMGNKTDSLQLYIQRTVLQSMPLRCLVMYSGGLLTFEILDLLLSVMNGEYAYAKAFCMLPGVLLSWLIFKCCGVTSRV